MVVDQNCAFLKAAGVKNVVLSIMDKWFKNYTKSMVVETVTG